MHFFSKKVRFLEKREVTDCIFKEKQQSCIVFCDHKIQQTYQHSCNKMMNELQTLIFYKIFFSKNLEICDFCCIFARNSNIPIFIQNYLFVTHYSRTIHGQ